MKNVVVITHPLIQHKLSMIRDVNTPVKEFRELIKEISMLAGYEITKDLNLKEVEIETPIATAKTKVINGKKMVLVPILRSGLGMLDGILTLIPSAKIGHMGFYRDPKTFEAIEYYKKIPDHIEDCEAVVLDPMLATGGCASKTINVIKESGITDIKFLCLIASKQGIERLSREHPDIKIYTVAIDEKINDAGYVVPGLGDASYRMFGTK